MPWVVLPSGERVQHTEPTVVLWNPFKELAMPERDVISMRPILLSIEHYNLDAAALRWLDAFLAIVPGGRLRVAELLD